MEIKRLGYTATRTDHYKQMVEFYDQVLGLRRVSERSDFTVFELPDGVHVEVFGPGFPNREDMGTGPMVGFAVPDLNAAVRELRSSGVELVGEKGASWQHFIAPDGNLYEVVVP